MAELIGVIAISVVLVYLVLALAFLRQRVERLEKRPIADKLAREAEESEVLREATDRGEVPRPPMYRRGSSG